MISHGLVKGLEASQTFFERTLSAFDEKNSEFVPVDGLFTVAQHVEHTAQTVTWFVDGAFGGKGFDMDFAGHEAEVRKAKSLDQARKHLADAFARAKEIVRGKSDAELTAQFPANDPIIPNEPKLAAVSGISDHTAHHRGALAVYARLCGKVPPMPYA